LSKEFLPIISSLLEGLNALQDSSHSQHLRDLFIGMEFNKRKKIKKILN
jgi:hypothetical protein